MENPPRRRLLVPAGLLLFDAHAHEHTSIAHTAFRVSGEDIDVIRKGEYFL